MGEKIGLSKVEPRKFQCRPLEFLTFDFYQIKVMRKSFDLKNE